MRTRRVSAVALVLVAAAAAPVAAAPPATIGGVVVDGAGKPLAHATVHVGTRMHGPGWIETDAHGRFHAVGLDLGRVRIEAFTDLLGAPVQWVTLAAGARMELRFVLAPSNIAGTVVDPRGKPIADGLVAADGPVVRGYWPVENGHFNLGGLSPGEYKITAGYGQSQFWWQKLPVVRAHSGDRHVVLVVPDRAKVSDPNAHPPACDGL